MRDKILDMDDGLYDKAKEMADIMRPIMADLMQDVAAEHDSVATGLSVGGSALIYLAIDLSRDLDDLTGVKDRGAERAMVDGLVKAINDRMTIAAQRRNGDLN